MRIEARAPTRIDLAGGTLDIWPLYLFHPGALTVNCAITRHASCTVETAPRGSRRITLISLDTRRRESFASLEALAARDPLPVAAAGATGALFPSAGRFHAHDHFRGARRRGDRRLERHGRGHLRGARPVHRRRARPPGLDSHQPGRGGDRDSRSHGHAGSLPAGIRRSLRASSRTGRREARGTCAATSRSWSAAWCCATRASRGNRPSTTGKCLRGTSTATGACCATRSRSRRWRCRFARRWCATIGAKSAG